MTLEEFSNEFDTYIVNHVISEPFDEYEKSVFLTKAQETIVESLYKGTLTGNSYEETEALRRYLSELVETYSTGEPTEGPGIYNYNTFFKIPEDVWFITYEEVTSDDNKLGCAKDTILEVVPVTHDEFHKTNKNPFRGPNKRRVLRLDINNNLIEIASIYHLSEYKIRYIRKPSPIILVDLPNGLTINKISVQTECKLNSALHRLILDTAIKLAVASRTAKSEKN